MSENAEINSSDYWRGRFSDDWEKLGGPRQSRFFALLAIQNLPLWLLERARSQSLSIADWGCAQGDGTDVWGSYVDRKQLTGIDFSGVAVEQARKKYPAVRFLAEDWLEENNQKKDLFDIIFSSNTLEHFYQPWDVLKVLLSRARKAVVLALPYRELDRIPEHFYSFLPQNIPLNLKGGVLKGSFRLVFSKVVDCSLIEDTQWSGGQIVLVYAQQDWIDSLDLTLADCCVSQEDHVAHAAGLQREIAGREDQIRRLQEELLSAERKMTLQQEQILFKNDQLSRLGLESNGFRLLADNLSEKVERLRQEGAMREGVVAGLNKEIVARNAFVAEVNEKLLARDAEFVILKDELAKLSAQEVLRESLAEKEKKLQELLSSSSWRMTRPLRGVKRLLRSLGNRQER